MNQLRCKWGFAWLKTCCTPSLKMPHHKNNVHYQSSPNCRLDWSVFQISAVSVRFWNDSVCLWCYKWARSRDYGTFLIRVESFLKHLCYFLVWLMRGSKGVRGGVGKWQGSGPPGKSQGYRVLSNHGPDPLENHKAANIGSASAHQRNANDGLLLVIFGYSLASSTDKKQTLSEFSWAPYIKTFWIRARG